MNIPNLTSSHLQLLLDLTRKREAIAADLKQLEEKIAGLFGNHQTEEPAPVVKRRGRGPGKKPKAVKIKAVKAPKASKTRVPRGTLKAKVLAVLKEAGAAGLSVGDVADKIGAKKPAVNVWFYTTGKKVPGLKKIAPGRFAIKG